VSQVGTGADKVALEELPADRQEGGGVEDPSRDDAGEGGEGQVDVLQLGTGQGGVGEIGIGECGAREGGVGEIGPRQVGPSEVGVSKGRPGQVGPGQVRPLQVAMGQLGPGPGNARTFAHARCAGRRSRRHHEEKEAEGPHSEASPHSPRHHADKSTTEGHPPGRRPMRRRRRPRGALAHDGDQ
jgi:hypothetical protein